MKQHQFPVTTRWTGNQGTGTSSYTAYSRNHELSTPGKATQIAGSSAVARGDQSRYNPEELLVGALSACHMMWVLHLCSDAGIVVTDYTDDAVGEMAEHRDGSGEFTRVVLRPRMTITDAARMDEAKLLHDQAHRVCCLARSMNFPVEHEATVVAG
ncbi:MAG TPA: OsmC family protein [Candidatus Sulfopaludibacter sp.]|nr:OsmC family protein [Candidatus Sulfopaludibacter sp.]